MKASPDLPIGYELADFKTSHTPMRVSGFAAGGWTKEKWQDNIHEDGYAAKLGYKGGLVEAHTVMEHALLTPLLDFFGPESLFTTAKFKIKECGGTYLGDKLVGKAKVSEKLKEGMGTRIVLDVRIHKEDGTLVQIGTVSAVVR